MAMSLHRSLLFVPGSRPELLDKARRSGADALILDLEDAVAEAAKPAARVAVGQALAQPEGPPAYVRLNHPSAGDTQADLDALAAALGVPGSRLEGVLLPKAERADDIHVVASGLERIERAAGVEPGRLALIPMVESCLGLRNAYELLGASPRVQGIVLASAEEGDFIVDLGGRWTPDSLALLYPRSRLVCEARAAGVSWIIDGVFMNLADNEALRRESRIAQEIGFVAKMAIHPSQLEAIHAVFTPSEAEVAQARSLLAAYEQAVSEGLGAVRHEGRMVDAANARLARRVLALAER